MRREELEADLPKEEIPEECESLSIMKEHDDINQEMFDEGIRMINLEKKLEQDELK